MKMRDSNIRLDIGGPKGNAFYILGLVGNLGKSQGLSEDEIAAIRGEMKGTAIVALGGPSADYEHLVRTFIKYFPFVRVYASYDVGLPKDICEVWTPDTVEL